MTIVRKTVRSFFRDNSPIVKSVTKKTREHIAGEELLALILERESVLLTCKRGYIPFIVKLGIYDVLITTSVNRQLTQTYISRS